MKEQYFNVDKEMAWYKVDSINFKSRTTEHPNNKKIIVTDKDSGEELYRFPTIIKTATALRVSKNTINNILKGRRPYIKNYKFEYEED